MAMDWLNMDTQNDHTHMEIKTYIKNDQNESECVPWQQMTMHYQEMGLVCKYEHNVCHTSH